MRVQTLLGSIDAKDLGFTYSHEHLLCSPPYWVEQGEEDLLLDNRIHSEKEIYDFKQAGGQTIVDATAIDYGREVEQVADISKKLNLQIIGTAGFNKSFLWEAKLPAHLRKIVGNYETYEEWIDKATISELTDFARKEIEEGMEGSPYKAGQLKFGTGYNSISSLEEKTIKAISRAHHETNAPVHSHTEVGTMALEQIDILKEEQVNLEHVSFGHMDRNPDPYYHHQIAKTGAYLSFDGIGKIKYAPESTRIALILELVKKGYEDQILVSGDTARKSYFYQYKKGPGFTHIINKWIPRFIDEANTEGYDGENLVKKFFIENPARCFSFKDV